ncbi:ApoD6 [Ramazzottius varieornatus]|uniref:ApoD6 n=1 Tax=Ramazzottius varieornatus TaxID=947166 RepID=A0A1D1VS51_RAMVA|nr:ApoD6 [Ramazzottius varieornatus]
MLPDRNMVFNKAFVLVSLGCLAICAYGSVIPGRCPVVPVKTDFQPDRYLGVWYEIRKYFSISDYGLNCSKTNVTKLGTNLYRLDNSATGLDKNGNKTALNTSAAAYAPNPSIPAKLSVLFGKSAYSPASDYWIVDSDYTNFTIVWSCRNVASGLLHNAHAWVISRNITGFSPEVEAKIDASLSKSNIDSTLFRQTVQTGCVN